jgi:drug/metabolite transporter (DMT)-like permease
MLLGGILLLSYYRFVEKKKIDIKKADYSLFMRIIFFHIFFSYTLEYWALDYVTSAKTCLLYNLSPFITAIYVIFE